MYLPLFLCTKITLIYDTEKNIFRYFGIYDPIVVDQIDLPPLEWANDYVIMLLFRYETSLCHTLKLLIPALKVYWLF